MDISIYQTAPIDARAGLTQTVTVNEPSSTTLQGAPGSSSSSSIVPGSSNTSGFVFYLFLAALGYFAFKKGIL